MVLLVVSPDKIMESPFEVRSTVMAVSGEETHIVVMFVVPGHNVLPGRSRSLPTESIQANLDRLTTRILDLNARNHLTSSRSGHVRSRRVVCTTSMFDFVDFAFGINIQISASMPRR